MVFVKNSNCIMAFQVIYDGEPFSVNRKDSEGKKVYKREIKKLFDKKYHFSQDGNFPKKNVPFYFLLCYFYKKESGRDVDNGLKYTIDSLIHFVYADDKQVHYAVGMAIECESELQMIDVSDLDADIAMRIVKFAHSKYHRGMGGITYVECGEMNSNFFKFGLGEIWK